MKSPSLVLFVTSLFEVGNIEMEEGEALCIGDWRNVSTKTLQQSILCVKSRELNLVDYELSFR
jgi:hypothetical protein